MCRPAFVFIPVADRLISVVREPVTVTVTVIAEVNHTAELHATAVTAVKLSEERKIGRPSPFGAILQESNSSKPTTFSTVVTKTGPGSNSTVPSTKTAVNSPAIGKSSSAMSTTAIAAGEVEMTEMNAVANSTPVANSPSTMDVQFAMPTVNAVVNLPSTVDIISAPAVPDASDGNFYIAINDITVYLNVKVLPVTATVTESSTTTEIFLSPLPIKDFTSTLTGTSLTTLSTQSSSEYSVTNSTTAAEGATVTGVITQTTTTSVQSTSSGVADQIPARILGPQGSNATITSQVIITETEDVTVSTTTIKSTSTTTTLVIEPQPTTTLTRTVIWSNQTVSTVEASLDVISTLASDGSIPTEIV